MSLGTISTRFDPNFISQSGMLSNAQSPLLLPEIAQHIGSFAGDRERRDLAYTCKQLFSSVAPVIWKEIPDIKIVIQLIPGVKLVEVPYGDEGSGEGGITPMAMIPDDSLSTEDWTRYWFYAPFVQHLNLFAFCNDDYWIEGSRFLFTKLNRRPLLPNLRRLSFFGMQGHSRFDRLVWFASCLSPTLQRLRLIDIPEGPEEEDMVRPAWLLLSTLAKHFDASIPDVPSDIVDWDPSKSMPALLFPGDYQGGLFLFDNLPAPTSLRYLYIRLPQLWQTTIYILGCLPLLEELEMGFYDCRDEVAPTPNSNEILLPPDSFPSLRRLRLHSMPSTVRCHELWAIKPMFSGLLLLSLDIHMIDYGTDSGRSTFNPPQLIYHNCPKLESLSLHIGYKTQPLELMLDLLSIIPLKALCLYLGTGYNLEVEDPATCSWRIFPHLRHLSLSKILGVPELKLLPKIAKACPNLEWLHIQSTDPFGLREQPMDTGCVDHTAYQSIEIETDMPGDYPPYMEEILQEYWNTSCCNMSSFLKAIWPNASFLPLSDEEFD
ncbi:unnamed protein product [Rhizoctonia solani]|uniref:Uncharacterized protein n=1 Tax=Rhizoctonia solani TaxID=456999 RepID=A0A8H2X0L6_9AGAM|nr:unnamed protein product [Rhizoctonia solani]